MRKLLLLLTFLLTAVSSFAQADISVSITNYQTVYVTGSTVVYNISVVNMGPQAATNVTVNNVLSNGITQSSWTGPNGSGSTGTLYNVIPSLPSGGMVSYIVTIEIPNVFSGNIVSTASATSSVTDPNPANNEAVDTDSKGVGADLVITNTNNQDVYTPGTTTVYTVKVINNGPLNAASVKVVNPIPAGITTFSWTGTNGSSGNNVGIDNLIGSLASGASVTYTVTVQIPAGFTGNLVSDATVTTLSNDPVLASNQSIDTDVPNSGANLVVVNTNGQTTYTPGSTTTYTVTVTNNGPEAAANVQVQNAIPAGITNFSWTGNNGSSGTNVPLNNTIPLLANGASVVYTITVQIPITFTGSLTSTASATSTTPDLFPACTQCTDTDTMTNVADLVVTNTNNQNAYIQGGTSVYTVTVTNNGPQNATNVIVTNPIPAGITNFSWAGNGATGTTGLNNTILNLASGASIVYTITIQVPATFTGNLVSTASANSTVLDPNPASNQNIADTDVLATGADIVVVNTNGQAYYTAGTTSTYTVTVTNNGPTDATNVVVTNAIPTGITSFSWTGSNGSSGTDVALNNTIPSLLNGQTVTYTITLQIPAGFTGDLVSTSSAVSDTPDPNPACVACTDTDKLSNVADVVVTNTDGFTNYIAGQSRTYTVTVTNNGPAVATNVLVTNVLSAGINLANVTWTGNATSGTGAISNTIPTLAVGQSVVYTVVVPVPSNYSQTTNLVHEVVVTSATGDPNTANNQVVDTDVPNPFADLVLYKTNNQTQFLLNENTVYTIIVRNNGPSDAVNVVVTDPLPNGASSMTWEGSNGTSGVGNMTDVIPTLAVGQMVTYIVTVRVPAFFTSPSNGNLVNIPKAISSTPDNNQQNNQGPNVTDIDTPRPDFVTISSDPAKYTPEKLIKDILINEPCVQLSNFSASAPISFGYFHKNNSLFPFREGIIIRSGIAANTQGKYTGNGTTSTGSGATDADLVAILAAAGQNTNVQDASFVKFDFVPTVENFSFNFLFASQEYGGFQCAPPGGGFVDAFAFILTNLNDPTDVQNLAVVPGTTTLISVPNIRKQIYETGCADANAQYFAKYNASTAPGVGPVSQANVDASEINLKGQTTSMVAKATVIPNTPYSIKLVIADVGDSSLDSAVFLEAGSFNIGGPNITGTDLYAEDDDFSGPNAVCEGTTRIIRAGTALNPSVTYEWKKDGVVIPGATTYFIEVSEPGVYTVTFTYGATNCSQSDDIVIDFAPAPFQVEEAEDLYVCADGTQTFDLTENVATVLASYNPNDFDVFYYHTQAEAEDLVNGIAFATSLDASNLETVYPGVDGETVFVKFVNQFTGGYCDPIKSFQLFLTPPPTGTFSYPDDGGDPGYCIGSNVSMMPLLAGLTPGGTFTAAPAGLTIVDAATGEINLNTSTQGTYDITYDLLVPGCAPFQVTTQIIVEACIDPVASNSGNVCEGTPTFDLFATGTDPLITYAWSGPNGFTSTLQNPVGVPVPTAPGSYVYSVVATIGGVSSNPSNTTLIVHPTPSAIFVSASTTICTNATTTIQIQGTPAGSSVTLNDGTNDFVVVLDALGVGNYTTPALSSDTNYSLVKVVSNTTPACEYLFPTNPFITISVGLPSATIVGFADPVICSGDATTLTIQGTPGAEVTYSIGTTVQPTVTIGTGGTAVIPVPGQTYTNDTVLTYTLNSIVSNSTPPCSDTITGQSATLTINALPTASFTTSTPTVCENTPATINFVGTPGAEVTYNDGTSNIPITLNAGGTFALTTANLPNPDLSYTFTLVSVSSTTLGVTCTAPLTGSVTIDVDANPAITTNPVGTTVCIGDPITLTVVATGANLNYQWVHSVNGNVGPNSPSFTISSPTNADAGDYTVIVSGSCGTPVTSAVATLDVNQPTIITTQPVASTTVCVGQPISLTVVATGINLTYQWKLGTNVLTGQTTSTLNIPSATLANAGIYTCDIINPCDTVTTANAVVIVNELPAITGQPQATTTICSGEGISLSVVATGTNLTYQWFLGTNPIPAPAGTAATYTDASVTVAEAGNYTVRVSGACTPAVTSNVALVVVNQGPVFTTQPVANTTVCSGDTITLTVATTGGSGVTYQWKQGANNVPGGTSDTLIITGSEVADSGVYTCVVSSNSCPDITSAPATVTVNQAPSITSQPESKIICVNDTVSFTIQATGTNVTYQWYKGTDIIAGATSNVYTIPSATEANNGNYTCVVSSTSCPSITSAVATLLVRPLPVATLSNGTQSEICSGESSEVVFEGTPGAVVTYTINGGTPETVQLVVGPTPVATGSLTESSVYELVSVTYTGNDACSQTLTGSVTVIVHELPVVALEDGYICVDPVTNAVTRNYVFDTGLNEGDYIFEWSNASGVIPAASNSFYEASAVGQYSVKITDIVTLCEQTAFGTVYQSSPPLSFTYTVNGFFSQNPTVTITAQPAGDYEYQLDYGPFQESNVFDNITMGEHTITVRDPQACDVLTDTVTIIDYPKYFTPNGDGIHDTWNISEFGEELNAKIYIFDRFGKLVKEISTKGLGWDGTFNGQLLPATDYWFTLDYEENGVRKEFKAHFSLKR